MYAILLRHVEGAPIVLFLKGEYNPDDRLAILLVGGESVTMGIAGETVLSLKNSPHAEGAYQDYQKRERSRAGEESIAPYFSVSRNAWTYY
jgi:hypothetical protein